MPNADPRVFFAAERTLLAWLRTGITIIGLGFVVSRFGLFLQLLATQTHRPPARADLGWAALLGFAFVLIGASSIALAAFQHRRFVAGLSQIDLPQPYARSTAIALSWVVALLGLALAIYMLMSEG